MLGNLHYRNVGSIPSDYCFDSFNKYGNQWFCGAIRAALFHTLFANYGDVLANVLNFMSVPVREFLATSLRSHYRVQAPEGSAEFELIYSTMASTFFVGMLFAGFTMGYMMDNYGRKGTAVLIRDWLGVGSGLCMVAAHWFSWIELFILGQFLAGMTAVLKISLFIYMSECSPDVLRGFTTLLLGSGGHLLILASTMLSLPSALGTTKNWWVLPGICSALALVHVVVAGRFFPESPKHLLIENRMCLTTRYAVQYYHGNDTNVDSVIEEYKRERNLIHHRHVTVRDVIRSRRLKLCLAIILINALIPATSMVNLKSQYLEPMLMEFGLKQATALLVTMLLTAITAPLCILAPFLVERFGRRPLFLTISALASAELVCMAGAKVINTSHDGNRSLAAPLALIGFALGGASSTLGLLHMNAVLLGELCPHAARTSFTKIVQIVSITIASIAVICYPIVSEQHAALFFALEFVINFALLILSILYLPETKEIPVDEIFKLFGQENSFSSSVESHDPFFIGISETEREILLKDPILQVDKRISFFNPKNLGNAESDSDSNSYYDDIRTVASYGALSARTLSMTSDSAYQK